MGVVLKMFLQSETVDPEPGSLSTFTLGAVCRGETNKDWAAATPAGQAKIRDQVLTDVWAAKRAGERFTAEVYVYLTPVSVIDAPNEWTMESCNFTYGGCAVKFRQKSQPWGTLEMTVNASPATKVLRKAFADGLLIGTAPTFKVNIEDAPDGVG